jgi:hypothetical protein
VGKHIRLRRFQIVLTTEFTEEDGKLRVNWWRNTGKGNASSREWESERCATSELSTVAVRLVLGTKGSVTPRVGLRFFRQKVCLKTRQDTHPWDKHIYLEWAFPCAIQSIQTPASRSLHALADSWLFRQLNTLPPGSDCDPWVFKMMRLDLKSVAVRLYF